METLTLVFEELVSNAVRHGGAPVLVEVTEVDRGWLIDVSDAAADRPPSLAVGRDPARGGLGLFLTAALSTACGWIGGGDRKHVWAHTPYARPEPASADLTHRRAADRPGDEPPCRGERSLVPAGSVASSVLIGTAGASRSSDAGE